MATVLPIMKTTFAVCMFLLGCGGYAEPTPTTEAPVDPARDPAPTATYDPVPATPGEGIKTTVCRVHTDAEIAAKLPPRDYACCTDANPCQTGTWRWGDRQTKCETSFPEVGATCEMYNGEPGLVTLR